MSNRSKFLIGSGILNLIHGGTHIIQFIQSMFLINYSNGCSHGWLDSPYMSFVWGAVGIVTLVTGIYDYRHHKKCHD